MSSTRIRVLVADWDGSLRTCVRVSLAMHGYVVDEARSGEEALQCAGQQKPDLVLLDMDIPGERGLTACQRLRTIIPQAGLVMIANSNREEDKVEALDAGADDYVLKPFSARELIARLRAIARRRLLDTHEQPLLKTGDLELNAQHHTFRKAGVAVRLSPTEFDLLSYLMRHADTPVEHGRLLRAVWGPEYGSELEYLRTYVKRLRQKIETDPLQPKYLITVPWHGYAFCTPAPRLAAAANM